MDTPNTSSRKRLALRNVARRRSHVPERAPVDLAQLVRVHLLDGSSKVLQMKESSTARQVLEQLKFNMDLSSIKTFALYRVCGAQFNRIDLETKVKDALQSKDGEGDEVRILFKSWISDECGPLEKEAMQDGYRTKTPNSALWLKYLEAVFAVVTGNCYLTEDEALTLGCLKMQADSGDYRGSVCTVEVLRERIADSFPDPLRLRMRGLLSGKKKDLLRASDIATRAQLLYSRLAGHSKQEAQIEYIRSLRTWCPFYGASFFSVDCQYDDRPDDPDSEPPVIKMTAAITTKGIYLITKGSPPIILRQPYNRIVKWTTHLDMNIFCFWVLKEKFQLRDILHLLQSEESQFGDEEVGGAEGEVLCVSSAGAEFDPNLYCDCIYLVTEEVTEIEFLVACNVDMLKTGAPPLLPGDTPEDDEIDEDGEEEERVLPRPSAPHSDSDDKGREERGGGGEDEEEKSPAPIRRTSVLNSFFQALSGSGQEDDEFDLRADRRRERSGQGISDKDFEQEHNQHCDDTATISNSVFRQTGIDNNTAGETDALGEIDMVLASSMSDLSELAFTGEGADGGREVKRSAPPETSGAPRRNSLFRWASISS